MEKHIVHFSTLCFDMTYVDYLLIKIVAVMFHYNLYLFLRLPIFCYCRYNDYIFRYFCTLLDFMLFDILK